MNVQIRKSRTNHYPVAYLHVHGRMIGDTLHDMFGIATINDGSVRDSANGTIERYWSSIGRTLIDIGLPLVEP